MYGSQKKKKIWFEKWIFIFCVIVVVVAVLFCMCHSIEWYYIRNNNPLSVKEKKKIYISKMYCKYSYLSHPHNSIRIERRNVVIDRKQFRFFFSRFFASLNY